jgi:serine/threonine protein kinase/Tol biopolymer transport system component
LDKACRADVKLRATVDSMLAAHAEAGSFGETPVLAPFEGENRLPPGSQLGAFLIERLLGAGGMGEVYRAQDTKLRRAVAIKVLPDAVARDADRRARFEQEALALAALNHPNIGAIYGFEEGGDVAALVLELVDGPTLAERLAAGAMPIVETVAIARQIAEALEAAHDRGIVHRDLKPANIKMTPEGVVKVLDFGLAKAMTESSFTRPHDASALAQHDTQLGVVVGTAAYMSPEQARGLAVDKRTDIWAFGCVLFEMCAHRPPFEGATVSETLAAVIAHEPDWTQLPPGTSEHLIRLLRRCLTKDPKLRLRDIGEARIALTADAEASLVTALPTRGPRFALAAAAVAALLLVTGAFFAGRDWREPGSGSSSLSPVRFLVFPPEGDAFSLVPSRNFLALSPDGSQIAFVAAGNGGRVWLRAMTELDARPVPGTEGAASVFWSPDGRSLAFTAAGKLKRIDLPAGAAVTIGDAPAWTVMHGTWGAGGDILLGTSQGAALLRVAAAGGAPREILTPNRSSGEVRVHWPWFLPDGRRFLYTVRLDDGEGELRIGQLDGPSRTVMRVSSNTQWVDPDIVVFARESVLMGQRIDLESARPIGEPFSIAEQVAYLFPSSRAMFSASRTGDVAYHTGRNVSQLVWADRQGNEIGNVGGSADYALTSARLSASGNALLVARRQGGIGTMDIWRLDLVRQTEERLTTHRGSEVTPIWIENERAIAFAADRAGSVPQLFRKDLATGEERQLVPGSRMQEAMDVFPDTRTIAYIERSADAIYDIYQLALTAGASPVPLHVSPLDKIEMRLSSDGRAMAFLVTDAARADIYVAALPVTSAPVLVASNVGGAPRWSADGRRIFYLGDRRQVMSLAVRTAPTLTVGTPQPLFELKRPAILFDVARDGRFLLLVRQIFADEQPITIATAAIGPGRP